MTQFEDKLRASARRLAIRDNRRLHVPRNPMPQRKTYWGWVATPAAAVAGLVVGMSLHLFVGEGPDESLALPADTVRIFLPVHDTLYLTQVVEKEKVVKVYAPAPQAAKPAATEHNPQPEECTSILCDGIDYAALASN